MWDIITFFVQGVVPGSGFVFRVRDPLPSLVDSVFVDSSSFSIYGVFLGVEVMCSSLRVCSVATSSISFHC